MHLFGHNCDHDYYFELPCEGDRDTQSIARCSIAHHGDVRVVPRANRTAQFYYFRLEDQVPENHLLRLIEKHISFEFVRERLRNSYSETGRPSIDPELLLRGERFAPDRQSKQSS